MNNRVFTQSAQGAKAKKARARVIIEDDEPVTELLSEVTNGAAVALIRRPIVPKVKRTTPPKRRPAPKPWETDKVQEAVDKRVRAVNDKWFRGYGYPGRGASAPTGEDEELSEADKRVRAANEKWGFVRGAK